MNISCRMLDDKPSDEQLKDVAGLIYDTDPYIYPALFPTKEEAKRIIPKMILSNDKMFNVQNLFVAEYENSIVGIILWHKGPMYWEPDIFYQCGGKSPYTDKVHNEYFIQYSKVQSDTISIINACVKKNARGIGVGKTMFKTFCDSKSNKQELFVLEDNKPAIKLYSNNGFFVVETVRGFSIDNRDLRCLRMLRASNPQKN